ncbi:MAG TPA: hypothetical protein VEO54_26225 [Thermoanaerobaculia bacterium]|nr:hypothetical protein [Thermoanaerobaculia bacterium]
MIVFLVALLVWVACAPSETRVTAEHRRAPLDLAALHSTGIPAMANVEPAQKIEITRACTDIGAEVSIRLHDYFRISRLFCFAVAPLIALVLGAAMAFVYWRILARRRQVGWIPLLSVLLVAWLAAAVTAVGVRSLTVLPALSSAVAANRTFVTLAQEGWIPASADDTQRDFTANCSDRIMDLVQGSREGQDALKRYRTIFRAAETLPPEGADTSLDATILQNRAKDLSDLYAVDTALGKSQLRALTWNAVTTQNSRFAAATDRQGGWWIHSSAHPLAVLIIAAGIPLIAWGFLLLFSKRVTATVARNIRKAHPWRAQPKGA